ncbi:DUF4189 domain-containing protein [Nocardia sp. NPDC004068]|uniref:DUF4189 domain-containing protein n=1 Tax=Nocardia sp. NPDC004068 TaxID=3364303 RepID=UPI0036834903
MGRIALGVVACAGALVSVAAPAQAERGPDGHLYGAMALSGAMEDGWSIGTAFNYPDQASADADARDECAKEGAPRCVVVVRAVDGCAAISRRDDIHAVGTGATRAEAERNAIAALGPGHPPSLSSEGSGPAVISHSACNG